EIGKTPLLTGQTGAGRSGRFHFQGPVKTLMPAILFRAPGLDALGKNAKPDPPDRQPAQTAEAGGSEWRAVVSADRSRQPKLAECCLEDGLHVFAVGFRNRAAAQQIAAVSVGDRQRVAALAVGAQKPPFEVRAPDVVGPLSMAQWVHMRERAAARGPRPRHALPPQEIADS